MPSCRRPSSISEKNSGNELLKNGLYGYKPSIADAARKNITGVKMALRKVTAIVRIEVLEEIEEQLEAIGVPGISVTYVKGFGNYANFFKSPRS